MIKTEDLEVFFNGLEARLEGAAEYRAKSARLIGADFRIFRFIDYEKQFSAILADLIDPAGTHGQGSTFLSKFLVSVHEHLESLESLMLSFSARRFAGGDRCGLSGTEPATTVGACATRAT